MDVVCSHCGALHWIEERVGRAVVRPVFSMCCLQGKVRMRIIEAPPVELKDLFRGDTSVSKRFLSQIRTFNNAFAFASFGTYTKGQKPQFAQIYFHDSSHDDEVARRLDFIYGYRNRSTQTTARNNSSIRDKIMDKDIIDTLQRLMYAYNPYAQILKTVGERVRDDNSSILGLKLICRRGADARRYNRPTVDEVAAIIPSGSMDAPEDRDIVVQLRNNKLRRVSALHPAYFPLSYPLLFIRGEDGFNGLPYDIEHPSRHGKLTMMDFFAYRLQCRIGDYSEFMFRSKRLLQQLMVDMFCTMDMNRISYLKQNQQTIRAELFSGLQDAFNAGDVNAAAVGRKVILPSSYVGGPRFMQQLYQDAIAIVRATNSMPDYFITFTCNP
ncbi:hypothetical protein K457DRAFT_60613, partial [Linnemannia elongata AG-77]